MNSELSTSRAFTRCAFLSLIGIATFIQGAAAASATLMRINNSPVAGYTAAAADSAQPLPHSSAAGCADTSRDSTASDSLRKSAQNPGSQEARPDTAHPSPRTYDFDICATLGGNLPKVVAGCAKPYLVAADVYVPQGKTVRIEPGTVLLFKNFTGLHVEGKLLAEGTVEKPIVFSSEFDHSFNTTSALHANPFDWNGMYIHEGGLGSSLAHCTIRYSVYGINSLTKYIRLDSVSFLENGRSDCVIEGQRRNAAQGSLSYALTLDDARKDGVPVHILMDPKAKKRNVLKYGGLTVLTGGCFMAVFSALRFQTDQTRLNALSDKTFVDEKSNIYVNSEADWSKAQSDRNVDLGLMVVGILGAAAGAVGFGISFTF